jgi:hypothetical protein
MKALGRALLAALLSQFAFAINQQESAIEHASVENKRISGFAVYSKRRAAISVGSKRKVPLEQTISA